MSPAHSCARYERRDGVAVISLDNPPVNGLSHAVRRDVAAFIDNAQQDDAVRLIVLIGEGKLFCAGADIREFNTPAAAEAPTLRDLIDRLEGSAKPVIAALHGGAYGGGLELAIGCHYRVATDSTPLALPEVKLGLLPGAGGTQRLPRLVGAEEALKMIVSGDPIDAKLALDLGLIDEIIDGDLLSGTLAFAHRVASTLAHPIASRRPVALTDGGAIFEVARSNAATSRRGFRAPQECISCVEASVALPFEQGMAFERERFNSLLADGQSKALRHLFFAEREAAKRAPDIGARSLHVVRKIGKIGVVIEVGEGSVGNRMLTAYMREAGFLLEEGAMRHQIDRALYAFGMATEPFASSDSAGLDSAGQARERRAETHAANLRASTIADEEIVERMIYALINEGARILDERVAQRASDIDFIYVHGYGFPAWRGGPMFHADSVGLDKILARIRRLQEKHGERWKPAPLLERLASEGARFNQS